MPDILLRLNYQSYTCPFAGNRVASKKKEIKNSGLVKIGNRITTIKFYKFKSKTG
jgi:hypothetical protein